MAEPHEAARLISRRKQLLKARDILRAREDPAFFAEYIMVDERTGDYYRNGEIHNEMHRYWSKYSRVAMRKAREHGGSSQLRARTVWEIGKNPDIRIKYISSTEDLAKPKVRSVRQLIENSPRVKEVFPHLRPGGSTWSDMAFTVQRKYDPPDPTLEARGVLSSATGGRADLIIFDDATAESSIEMKIRERVIRAVFNTWMNLVTSEDKGGRVWWMSNVWHPSDASAEIVRRKTFHVLEMFIGSDMEPIWPEEWPKKRLIQHRETIGELAFSRGFMGRPWDDTQKPVQEEWINFYLDEELPYTDDGILEYSTYLGVDLAISAKPTSNFTAVVVIARDDDRNVYVLETIRRRIDFPTTLKLVAATASRWNPTKIVIESVGYQSALAQSLKKAWDWPVKELKHNISKWERMRVYVGEPAGSGKLYLRGQPVGDGRTVHSSQRRLWEELVEFDLDNCDTAEALSFAMHHAIGGKRPGIRWLRNEKHDRPRRQSSLPSSDSSVHALPSGVSQPDDQRV